MQKVTIQGLMILFITLVPSELLANDTTATVTAGAIVYKVSDEISMDEEVLKLSLDKVNVFYRFFNHTNHEIEETIAFPLPPIPYGELKFRDDYYPTWDEEFMARQYLDENPEKKGESPFNSTLKQKLKFATFVNFERTVNGESYAYQYQTRAITPDGRDITKLLQRKHIPLSFMYLRGFMEEGELSRNATLRKKIKTLGLLSKSGEPIWRTETTYFWTERFAPRKETLVTHAYRPHPGAHWMSAKDPKTIDEVQLHMRGAESPNWSEFCVSPKDASDIVAMMQRQESPFRVYDFQYILKTGSNWKGNIKKFRLEITPPLHTVKTLFCWNGSKEIQDDGVIVSDVQNFKPNQNLRILFITNDQN